jgi:DNA repair photolyase
MEPDNPPDPPKPIKGRGAVRNVTGRFETVDVVPFDDGWGSLDQETPKLLTTTLRENTRTIISTNDSPDVPFNRSINPYKGCEHGCVYCFARPSHAYLNLSPGLDFESMIVIKPDAPELLRASLSKPGYVCETIALGSNTDPYQPLERKLRITRGLLEVLSEFRHPCSIVTKSNMVLRDLDLLVPMARRRHVVVLLSVTSLDDELARRMEPRAPAPRRRLQAIEALQRAGVPVGVLVSPIVPGLNDEEVERILEAVARAGAGSAAYLLLRLPHEVKQLFVEWLAAHYPDRADKVLSRMRQMREGQLYQPEFGVRMSGRGPFADLLRRRFDLARRRLGLPRKLPALDVSGFHVPGRAVQRSLFE